MCWRLDFPIDLRMPMGNRHNYYNETATATANMKNDNLMGDLNYLWDINENIRYSDCNHNL